MKRDNFDHLECPVAATLSVIGDHWSVLIVRDIFCGLSRFDEFQAHLGIARNVLSARLKKLCAEGIVRKCQTDSGTTVYSLTEDGLALRGVLIAMAEWGEIHRAEKSGSGRLQEVGRI